MQALDRTVPKSELIEQYENCDGLTEEMKERMKEYLLSLHGIKENTKGDYLSKIKMFGIFLSKHGIARFEDVNRKDIDLFLSRYENENTLNLYIHAFRSFFKFINKEEAVRHLKIYSIELEQITPSEILTPEEVVAIVNESGKRRELVEGMGGDYDFILPILKKANLIIAEPKHGCNIVYALNRNLNLPLPRKSQSSINFSVSYGNPSKKPILYCRLEIPVFETVNRE
jgi:hypothetical protein